MSPDRPDTPDADDAAAGPGIPDAETTAPLPRIEDDVAATRELPAYQEPVHHEPAPGAPYRATVPPYAPPPPGVHPTAPAGTARQARNPLAVVGWVMTILLFLVIIVLVIGYITRAFGGDEPTVTTSAPATPTASESASPSPTTSPSPSVTPSTTPTPTPTATTPAPTGPTFVAWDAPSSASCPNSSDIADITITWISEGAVKAWIGVDTDNAKVAPYDEVPPSGSYTLGYPCSNATQRYTVTLEDSDGNLTHKSVDISSGAPS